MYLAVNGRAVQPVMALLRCDKILGNTREVHYQWWVEMARRGQVVVSMLHTSWSTGRACVRADWYKW